MLLLGDIIGNKEKEKVFKDADLSSHQLWWEPFKTTTSDAATAFPDRKLRFPLSCMPTLSSFKKGDFGWLEIWKYDPRWPNSCHQMERLTNRQRLQWSWQKPSTIKWQSPHLWLLFWRKWQVGQRHIEVGPMRPISSSTQSPPLSGRTTICNRPGDWDQQGRLRDVSTLRHARIVKLV